MSPERPQPGEGSTTSGTPETPLAMEGRATAGDEGTACCTSAPGPRPRRGACPEVWVELYARVLIWTGHLPETVSVLFLQGLSIVCPKF